MNITIVIPGYKSLKYLEENLSSIYEGTDKNIKVLFIEDYPDDKKDIKYIKKHYPKVKIIQNKKNLRFPKSNNKAFKIALKDGADYIFMLNDDTVIDKNCIKILKEEINKYPNTILMPVLLIHNNGKKTNKINTLGNYQNYLGVSYVDGYKKNIEIAKEKNIFSASGASMIIPVKIMKKIGFLDESFVMYHEDLDFCWRARLFGFNIKLIPSAKVWHKYNFGRNKFKMAYFERNRLLCMLKNYEFKTLCLIFPLLLIHEILAIVFSLIDGWILKKIKTYFEIIKMTPDWLKKRRFIQKNRIIKDKDIKIYLKDTIDFGEVKVPFLNLYNIILKVYWKLIYKFI